MKSYLGLISKYAKVHKNKNRLTTICIAMSVMLVTAVFGMADMSVKEQISETIKTYGNWHIIINDISYDIAQQIGSQNNINVAGWLGMTENVYKGKELIIQSSTKELAKQMNLSVTDGVYPSSADEALLDASGFEKFGFSIGDNIEINFQNGQTKEYKITGKFNEFSSLKSKDTYGLQITNESMHLLPSNSYKEYYYVKFNDRVNIRQAISEMKQKYGLSDKQITTNIVLLGLMGQSDNTTMLEVYLTAFILFILVSMASIFMIASSFNMNILERIQFFGMLRCLGATKRQIKIYVRLESLQYCIKAIPTGLVCGIILLWTAIYILNSLNSKYLPTMHMFQISWIGIAAGILIGFLVVMIASDSPAKKAAKVSAQVAVTGNVDRISNFKFDKAINTKIFHIETAMGLHHAFSNKKSMLFISGSFAVSIIMFLCFSILINFMNYALSPLRPYSPDLSIQGTDNTVLIPASLKKEIKDIQGVNKVYGRMFYANIEANDKKCTNIATLISYDEEQFKWADDLLTSGNLNSVQNENGILIDYSYLEKYGWKIGDSIDFKINNIVYSLPIAAVVSDIPVDSTNGEWIVVCSEKTFTFLTKISEYQIIDVQLNTDVSNIIQGLLTSNMQLFDYQQKNNEVQSGYLAMAVFVYGFLIVIALVALINIVNTVNASASSRINYYKVMRAVGMTGKQLSKLICAEAAAYAFAGCTAGGIFGIIFHYFLFKMLVSSIWGEKWRLPIEVLIIIIVAAIFATLLSAVFSFKKIESIINAN